MMNPESSGSKTSILTQEGDSIKVHGIDIRCFNTSTNLDRVYIDLVDSDRRIDSSSIFNMWGYMRNRAIHVLQSAGFLDRYGRICRPINKNSLRELCERRKINPTDNWAEAISEMAYTKNLPQWAAMYPKALIDAVAHQLADQILKNGAGTTFSEVITTDAVIDISVEQLKGHLRRLDFWMSPDDDAIVMELDMENQYGNKANLIIKSNTDKSYDYLETLSTQLAHLGDNIRVILRYQQPKYAKILCTFLC